MNCPLDETRTFRAHKSIDRGKNRSFHHATIGCDVNAPDEGGLTPLHQAVFDNDIERISELLYLGADVTVVDGRNFTPFLQAVLLFNLPAVALLSKYSQHFCPRFSYGYYKEILDLRTSDAKPITRNRKFLEFMVRIWDRLDQHLVETDRARFLTNYLKECNSTKNYKLRGSCFFILEFTLPFYLTHAQALHKFNFVDLLVLCEQRLVVQRDRIGMIWTWLSLGAEVLLNDIRIAFKLYGYDEEVEALVSVSKSPLLALVLGLEESSSGMVFQKYISRGLESPIFNHNTLYRNVVYVIETLLNFFALPWRITEELRRKCRRFEIDDETIEGKLARLPGVPQLRELSRNQIVKLIKKRFGIMRVGEFETIVGRLEVPNEVKNVVLFKKGLYV